MSEQNQLQLAIQAEQVIADLKQAVPQLLLQQQQERAKFEEQLYQQWKDALILFDITVNHTQQCASQLLNTHREQAKTDQDIVFQVAEALWVRASQIIGEIKTLIRAGHPTGAYARWRTLYELVVCLALIAKYGQETAQAFVDFHVADEGKIWKKYQDARAKAGMPMTPHEVTHVEERTTQRSKLIYDYGVDKNASYGWATAAVGKKNPNLHELAEDVNLDGYFPYYQVAHMLIHASPTAIVERKIGSPLLDTLTTVGPHQEGLTEPIYLALVSLEDFMKILLMLRVNEQTILNLTVIDRLVSEVLASLSME